jgi:hypothetical protein
MTLVAPKGPAASRAFHGSQLAARSCHNNVIGLLHGVKQNMQLRSRAFPCIKQYVISPQGPARCPPSPCASFEVPFGCPSLHVTLVGLAGTLGVGGERRGWRMAGGSCFHPGLVHFKHAPSRTRSTW